MAAEPNPFAFFRHFLGALLLLFIGLKAARVIDWSWWLVLAPGWVPLGIALLGAVVYAVATLIEQGKSR